MKHRSDDWLSSVE